MRNLRELHVLFGSFDELSRQLRPDIDVALMRVHDMTSRLANGDLNLPRRAEVDFTALGRMISRLAHAVDDIIREEELGNR
jgi:hypothetical protein